LLHYRHWEVEDAIQAFSQAAALDPEEPDYHLNLVRAMVRFWRLQRYAASTG